MAFTVRKLATEPIAIVTIMLPIEDHIDSLNDANQQLATFIQQYGPPFYIVADLRHVELSVSDILLCLAEHRHTPVSGLWDPTTSIFLVGMHPVIGIAIRKVKQETGVYMNWQPTLEGALRDIRKQLATPPRPFVLKPYLPMS
ncbi:MAG: hypothetical protein JW966_10660 [Anaerolineae bacterium]|nr:hypothetical protein [Anaerolineae bacterium]